MIEPLKDEDIRERLIALTRDLILIPSIPSLPQERQRCYEFVRNHIESLKNVEIKEYNEGGIPSLVAVPPGCAKPQVLLCGHLDVITHPEVESYRSVVKDGRIYGPGAGDMKGALAILLEVFRRVHTHSPNASLGLAVTSDEEIGGACGIGYLLGKAGHACHIAMIPDGGSLTEVTVEEKGILHLKIEVQGHSAHAARPWLGENPIEALIDQLARMRAFFDGLKKTGDHWYPTCAVTIVGTENTTTNRVPSMASAICDIRFPPLFTVRSLLGDIEKILSDGAKAEVILSAEPTHLSPDAAYLQVTEKITGRKAVLIKDDGGSDARYFIAKKIPVMMSRPLVGNLHAQDEWIDINSMVLFYRIYEQYLSKKLRQ